MKIAGKILLILTAFLAFAAGQECSFHQYVRGLGNLVINALKQDDQGFIWAGTESGLFRFDGTHFTEFGRESGLPCRFIFSLGQDVTGRLWVVTRDGLAFRTPKDRFEEVLYKGHSLSFTANPAFATSPWGDVLVPTPDGMRSLTISNGKPEWHALAPVGSRANKLLTDVSSVLPRRDGSILFGCGTGICQLQAGVVTTWAPARGLPDEKWIRLLERFNGEVWARSKHHIVRVRAGSSHSENLDLPAAVNSSDSTVMVEDSGGHILAGLYSGVARFEDGNWNVIGEKNGFVEGTVVSLIIDRENEPWIGFNGRGLANWLGYDQWEHWTKRQGLASNQIWSFLRDSKGRLWAAEQQHINIFDPEKKQFHEWSGKAELNRVLSLAESKDGFIWITGRSGKLLQIDLQTLALVSETNVGSASHVMADSSGRIWVTSDKGLLVSRFLGKKRVFEAVPGLNGTFVDVRQAPNGEIWALSETNLYHLSTNGWQNVDISKAGLGNLLSDVAIDRDGWVWVDGEEFGAVRFRISNSVVTAMQRMKLSSQEVLFMGTDSRGWMWIGEDHGVEVFDGTSLHPYSLDNGLIWNDCDAKAFLADTDGTVWLGTSGGISHFIGTRLPIEVPSKPVLNDVQYGPHHLPLHGASMPWLRNSLIFRVSSMSFLGQKQTTFRYRLVGLESNWNETVIPEVRYTELSPRAYRFEIASFSNSSGRMSPVETFDIDITPPWYRTWSFALTMFLSALALGCFIWRWRVRMLVAKQRELESLVSQRTEELNERLEQQVLLQAEAERANRAKGDFLAMMSHEIRTPMNGVVGMTTLLESTELSEKQADFVKTIRESGSSLLAIINDILDFSKIEAGKMHLEQTEFSLSNCVDETLSVVLETALRKGIRLISQVHADLPPCLIGDPVRIKQILLNLVSNAVKFTSEGSVEVRVYPGENSRPDLAQIIFEVKDTGIGISPETQQRLFQSFTQAETSTTRKYGGTGLGLVICKRLVEMIGGSIDVESELGRGSIFRAVLNLQVSKTRSEEDLIAKPGLQKTLTAGPDRKILVAEDNQINQKVALRLLSLLGYSADIAENGAEALRLLQNGEYSAVLMDMHMPVMDGLETTRAIRNLSGAVASIPIIAVTANAIQGERQKCFAAGMNDFITKPIEREKFAAALERWTGNQPEEQLLSA